MLEKKIKAGKNVAQELFPTEHSIDAGIVGAARLIIATVENRHELRVTRTAIHPALTAAAEGLSVLVQAHGAIASVHDDAVLIRDKEGMPTKGYGCEFSCPPQIATGQRRPDLSLVS